jgi:hypothetical protein
MADLSITAASFVPGANAKYRQGVAGETVTQGQPLYLRTSDNRLYKADADASAEAALVVGIAANAGSAGQVIDYVYEDDDLTVGATMTMANVYVASGTAGGIAPFADFANGDYLTVLLVPKSTTKAVLKLVAAGAAAA